MLKKQWAIPAIMLVLVALAVSGCSSPATPQATNETPQDVVKNFWRAIDSGDYGTAYDLSYPVENVSRDRWIREHQTMWGDNGTNIKIYNFTVISNTDVDPATFPGNFTAIEAVVVKTDVSYYGKNTSGISQFAAVKDASGNWKFYGSY